MAGDTPEQKKRTAAEAMRFFGLCCIAGMRLFEDREGGGIVGLVGDFVNQLRVDDRAVCVKDDDGAGIREGVRLYSVYGKQTLDDAEEEWTPVADGDEGNYRFFKVGVGMP